MIGLYKKSEESNEWVYNLAPGTFIWLVKESKMAVVYGTQHKLWSEGDMFLEIDLAFDNKIHRWTVRPNGCGFDYKDLFYSISYMPEEFFDIPEDQDVRARLAHLRDKLEDLESSLDVKDILT